MPIADQSNTGPMLVVPNLRSQAAGTIRARIISGQIEPGRLYAIGQLAEELGVSATPVREALLDLAKDGLITMARNRGFKVRAMDQSDLDEILDLRRMLEVPAVRKIAQRGLLTNQEPLHDLARATEEAAAAGEWVAFLESDREFHLGLLSHLGSQRLVQIVGSLRDQGRLYGLNYIGGTPELMASTREHYEILEATVAGRADEAARLMDKHLNHASGIWAGREEGPSRH